jgi:hypothetical protein
MDLRQEFIPAPNTDLQTGQTVSGGLDFVSDVDGRGHAG